MNKISHRIEKTNQSTYNINIIYKRTLGNYNMFEVPVHVPLLDTLISFKGVNLRERFLNIIIKRLDYQKIIENEKLLNSFYSLFYLDITGSLDDFSFVSTKGYIEFISSRFHDKLEINYKISNSIILKLLDTERIKEIEYQVYEMILFECELLLIELSSSFNSCKSGFFKECLSKRKEHDQIETSRIFNSNKHFSRILKKNPDFNTPNLANIYGEELVIYISHFRKLTLYQHIELNLFDNKKRLLAKKNHYYSPELENNYIPVLKLDNDLSFDSERRKYYIMSDMYYFIKEMNLHFMNRQIPECDLDACTPIVKSVKIYVPPLDIDDSEISFELGQFNEESIGVKDKGSFIPFFNEDLLPCLLHLDLFKKYNIDGKIYFYKKDVISLITEKLEFLKSAIRSNILQSYIDSYILSRKPDWRRSENSYNRDHEKARRENDENLRNFFVNNLGIQLLNYIRLTVSEHQFTIPDAAGVAEEEFVRRSELIVNWFLKDRIEGLNWFDKSDLYGSISDGVFVPTCDIIWKNERHDSPKPFDVILQYSDIEYKVKICASTENQENAIYLTTTELQEIFKNKGRYFFIMLTFKEDTQNCYGIHSGILYRMKPNHEIEISKLEEYYKMDKIRFTLDKFEPIADKMRKLELEITPIPSVWDPKYWEEYDYFVKTTYFDDLERILNAYSEFPEVLKLWSEFVELKLDDKFTALD